MSERPTDQARSVQEAEGIPREPNMRATADLRPDSLLYEIFVLGQAVRRMLEAAMADGRLRPEEYAVYSVVFEPESITPTAMAVALSMPLTTVMDWVRLMERRGHARRRPHPTDGRASLVTLTAAGLRVHREANARFEGAYRAFVAALPMRETEARQALTTLRDAAILASKGVQPRGHTPSSAR